MDHPTPLKQVIGLIGLRPLASRLGVSYQAIQKFQRTGIPAERVIAIAEAADYAVTPHQLRPDIYPDPLDGLPPELREQPTPGAAT